MFFSKLFELHKYWQLTVPHETTQLYARSSWTVWSESASDAMVLVQTDLGLSQTKPRQQTPVLSAWRCFYFGELYCNLYNDILRLCRASAYLFICVLIQNRFLRFCCILVSNKCFLKSAQTFAYFSDTSKKSIQGSWWFSKHVIYIKFQAKSHWISSAYRSTDPGENVSVRHSNRVDETAFEFPTNYSCLF